MKTYEALVAEIKSFKPWRGPALAPGIAGFIHAPFRCFHVSSNNNGETRVETVDCLCGANLDYQAFRAPNDQPAPALWVGLEAFKKHLAERKEMAENSLERMRESHYDAMAGTR